MIKMSTVKLHHCLKCNKTDKTIGDPYETKTLNEFRAHKSTHGQRCLEKGEYQEQMSSMLNFEVQVYIMKEK